MSKVTVQFYGICTHVTLNDGTHRVILPNAGRERIDQHHVLARQRVQPHVARLQILKTDLSSNTEWDAFRPDDQETVWTWTLDGVTLRINDAADVQPPAVPDGGAFPSLNAYCCTPVELLPEYLRNEARATSQLAACFFDFPKVTPLARMTPDGEEQYRATVGVVAVETIERVEKPVISLRTSSGVEVLLTVEDKAEITVYSYPERAGSQSADKDADFLLHFLSATQIPARSWFPPAPPWEECREAIVTRNPPLLDARGTFTGPGCSNSNYP